MTDGVGGAGIRDEGSGMRDGGSSRRVGRLVEGADRACRVANHAKPAAREAARGGDDGAAQADAFVHAVIQILNRDVDQPLRRKIGVATARMADAGDRFVVGLHREVGVVAHLDRLGRPAHDRRIEVPNRFGITDGEILPGDRSRPRRGAHGEEFYSIRVPMILTSFPGPSTVSVGDSLRRQPFAQVESGEGLVGQLDVERQCRHSGRAPQAGTDQGCGNDEKGETCGGQATVKKELALGGGRRVGVDDEA